LNSSFLAGATTVPFFCRLLAAAAIYSEKLSTLVIYGRGGGTF